MGKIIKFPKNKWGVNDKSFLIQILEKYKDYKICRLIAIVKNQNDEEFRIFVDYKLYKDNTISDLLFQFTEDVNGHNQFLPSESEEQVLSIAKSFIENNLNKA